MPRLSLPLIVRRPEVPWPAPIETLRVAGIRTRRMGAAVALSHTTIWRWRRGTRPDFEGGKALLALAWKNRDLLPSDPALHCESRVFELPARFLDVPSQERKARPKLRTEAGGPLLVRHDRAEAQERPWAPRSDIGEASSATSEIDALMRAWALERAGLDEDARANLELPQR